MARHEDIIWAAGFFDGEGCISITRKEKYGSVYHWMDICVYQNDWRPLDDLIVLFGGKVNPDMSAQRWRVGGQAAAAALAEMLPYLRVKREQAEVAIGFQKRRLAPGAKRPEGFSIDLDERDYMDCKHLKKVA